MKIKSLNLTAREADEKAKLSQTCEPINRSKLQPRNIMLPECSYLLSEGSVFSTAWISQFVFFLLVMELNVYGHALITLSIPTENKTIRQIVRRSHVFLLKSPPHTHTHRISSVISLSHEHNLKTKTTPREDAQIIKNNVEISWSRNRLMFCWTSETE